MQREGYEVPTEGCDAQLQKRTEQPGSLHSGSPLDLAGLSARERSKECEICLVCKCGRVS